MLITYQKVKIEQLSQVEQVPLLHHAAWHLLKKSLKIGQQQGIVPLSLKTDIIKNRYGKPYFIDHPKLYFNLSHTLGYVACVIAEREVGIDIEKIRPYKSCVLHKVCTAAEKEWIKQSEFKEEAFFRLWTLKESFVKAEGTGLTQSLKQLEFQPDDKGKLKLKQDYLKYHFNQIIIDNQFVLSTCAKINE